MKSYRNTLMALAILAALVGVYVFQSSRPSQDTISVFALQPGSIVTINILSPNGPVAFRKVNHRWRMETPVAAAADQAKLAALERELHGLTAGRLLGGGDAAIRQYGLQHPGSQITVQTRDGAGQTLFIGAATPSQTEYYAASTRLENIFILNKANIDDWFGPPAGFRNKNLMTLKPALIESVQLTGASQTWQLKKENGRGGIWRLILPVQAPVKGERVRELLVKIAGLQIADFISQKGDPAERYGLDKPSFTLTVGCRDGKEQTVYFGKKDPDRRLVYVKINRNPAIYGIDPDAFRPEEMRNGAILDVAPLSVGIGEVTAITIVDQGKRTVLRRDRSKPQRDIFNLAGQAIDPEQFNPLYINLMALSAAGLDPAHDSGAPRKSGPGGPELSVIFRLRGNRNLRVDFSKRDESTYFMTQEGNPMPCFVTTQKITLVRQWLQRVVHGRS